MNLTCEELVEMLIDFLDGDLTPEQVTTVKEHLCSCPPCVETVETYQITIRICRSLPKTEPLAPAFEERLRHALASALPQNDG